MKHCLSANCFLTRIFFLSCLFGTVWAAKLTGGGGEWAIKKAVMILGDGDQGGRWEVCVSVYVCVFCQQTVFSQLWG